MEPIGYQTIMIVPEEQDRKPKRKTLISGGHEGLLCTLFQGNMAHPQLSRLGTAAQVLC